MDTALVGTWHPEATVWSPGRSLLSKVSPGGCRVRGLQRREDQATWLENPHSHGGHWDEKPASKVGGQCPESRGRAEGETPFPQGVAWGGGSI